MRVKLFQFIAVLVVANGSLLAIAEDALADQSIDPHKSSALSSTSQRRQYSRPATTVKEWTAQIEEADKQEIVQVTGVKLERTEAELIINLETAEGKLLQVDASKFTAQGNALVAAIPSAVLSLPKTSEFRADNPTSDIASVTVTQVDPQTIQISVVGTNALPTTEVTLRTGELAYSLNLDTGEEEEVVVTGDRAGFRYFAPDATTATKLDVPLLDIPASILVVPRQLIEDKQIFRLNDLADYVSGVQSQSGYGGLSSQGYYFRGFETSFETLRNGFRDFGFLSPRDVSNVERVEFLKGPASVLYGGSFGSIAGVVNTVTKKPLDTPFHQVNMTFGSFSFYRPTIDITGPLTPDKSLLYRLNLAYENAGNYRDFVENESIFVAPALTWRIGPRTTFTVEMEYQNFNYVFDRGLLPDPVFLTLPRTRFLGEPGFNEAEIEALAVTYNFEHNFSDNWKFRQGFNINLVSNSQQNVRGSRFSDPLLEEDGRTLPRRAEKEPDSDQKNYTLQNEIFGKFNTGSIRHNLLFGLELSRYRFNYSFFRAAIAPLDIFNPVYGAQPGAFELAYPPEEYGSDNLGIYIQDLIELLPNLKLLAGIRFDTNDSFYRNEDRSTDLEQTDSGFSPRLGLVYQPTETTSLYFSWSNSFNPQFFSRNRTGEAFEPETGEQFEVGFKQEFFDKRLFLNLAFFQITKQNVLTTDPADSDFSIQSGEQKSRGIELDVIGQILPGWDIIATYAYTDAFVSEDNVLPVGETLVNAAKHRASLWTKYEIQTGDLRGLGFGVGFVFSDERPIGLPNLLFLPSYVRADAALFYRRDNWRFALNFRNISNTKYQESQGNFYFIPAAPFSVYGTVSYQF